MIHRICYIVDKKVDGYISSAFHWNSATGKRGMSPIAIASLRGLYDTNADEIGGEHLLPERALDPANAEDKAILDEAIKKLMNFRAGIRMKHAIKASNATKHIDRSYDTLRHVWSATERKGRVHLISAAVSEEIDDIMEANPGLDRLSFVNGFTTVRGEKIGGVAAILENVYNTILSLRQNTYEQMLNAKEEFEDSKAQGYIDYYNAPSTVEEYKDFVEHCYKEYSKILENWQALIPFVLKDLVQREGVKLGRVKEYAVAAASDSFGDNDIAAKWDISESKRDGWQENSDMQSAFGSIGLQVRRLLSTVPVMQAIPIRKNGKFVGYEYKHVTDDLGNPTYMDPIKTHQALVEMLRGVQDSNDMINKLSRDGEPGTAKTPWMQPILDILTSNSQARTQFFVDFKKGFQVYSVMYEDEEESFGKIRKIKTRVINKLKNFLKNKYDILLTSRNSMTPGMDNMRVFDGEGRVNWERLAKLRETVLLWTNEDAGSRQTIAGQKVYAYNASPLLNKGKNASITIDGKAQRVTYDMRRDFLMDTFMSLGFDVSMDTVDMILGSTDIYKVREQLEQLFDRDGNTGIIYALSHKNAFKSLTSDDISKVLAGLKELAKESYDRKPLRFKSLYHRSKKTSNGRTVYPVEEHINKLLDIISKHQEDNRIESRARYRGNTMYSFVAPSYLSDKLEAIQSYVEKDDKEGLLNHLKKEYLNSMYFVDDDYIASDGREGRIYNSWLRDMVAACKDTKKPLLDSVAAIFTYERDLGSSDKKFEDFTTKEHALDMFLHFFADEEQYKGYGGKGSKNINKKSSAMYPVFILGDAGVSKYIRAPRISTPTRVDDKGNVLDEADANKTKKIEYRFDSKAQDQILSNFWDIYIQEKRRMSMEEAIAFDMYANGKKVKRNKGEFSILTFLNENSDEHTSKYEIPAGMEYDETTVKNIIKTYLDDMALNGIEHNENGRKVVTPSFKQRLETLGVLDASDTRNGKQYNYISSIANEQNIDDKVREFYWNTKLATANQLQLMTIDPSFYHGTKDLQKRYKEIHAPGSKLDIYALDFKGRPYSNDHIERVVYFDDISINAEDTNPEFMETILRIFSKEDADVDAAIADGILTPIKDDKLKETERQNKLVDLLGDNYSIYKAYMKNTLTDGQGYRTLKSYRKVMGMAGKWTQEMENAYNDIQSIRERHTDGSAFTDDELRYTGSLALVLQPIKPYMFTHERFPMKIAKKVKGQEVKDAQGNTVMVDTEMIIPVQHKYAEALIIPELMPKGSKLRDLAEWMDNHNIDMVGSTKIAKVGCFGQANISNVTNVEELSAAMNRAYVHSLEYADYRIQTNVPEHINASQLFGTQVRKLIMANLIMNADYSSYIGRDTINLSVSDDENDGSRKARLTGRNLLALYNSLICANIMESYEKFAQNADDIEKLAELLQQSTIGSMREAMDNIFSYVVTGNEKGLQKFFMPLFEGGLEHDSAAMILSTFKKIVNKQQISGGSAVQVSAFGIDGYAEDGNLRYVTDPDNPANILYAEIEMPFDRVKYISIKNADGTVTKQKVNLRYGDYCNANGTLIPTGEALEKGTAEWKKYQSYTYKEVDGKLVACSHKDPQAEVYKPKIEEEYPDILSILAYRIPTEKDYSMINCKIKRFTSKLAGGTLKVPPQGTTIAGFDFDIDKLYFMMREYHKTYSTEVYQEDNFSEGAKLGIWSNFYTDYNEIYEALKKAREEAEAKDPSLTKEFVTPSGKQRVKHLTKVNSYWQAANIEEIYGINKAEAFAKYAQKSNETPDVHNTTEKTYERFDIYNFDKSPEENSRAARNNLLIDLIQARLMDPQTAKERYTPGGFENASKAARLMRELDHGNLDNVTTVNNGVITSINLSKLKERQDSDTDPEPNYDPTDPYTILVYNQQNQVAGKLIGIFANENTNHAFASALDVFEFNEPIEFCGHAYKDLLHKDDPEMAWQASHSTAEYLAASVDAVKDPVLNFMNLNTITADAGAVLARLGYKAEEIGLLFKQPAIMKACEESFNRGININTVIDDVRRDLMSHATGININEKVDLTSDVLALGIVNARRMREEGKSTEDFLAENAKTQLAVLELFSKILKNAQDVNDFVLNTKFTASNAVSSTFGGLYAQQQKVQTYLDKFPKGEKDKGTLSYKMVVAQGLQETGMFSTPIENDEANLTMKKKEYLRHVRFNPFAYEQAMYDTNRKALKLLSKYYPYETDVYKGIRGRMQELARYGSLSEDEINEIHSNIPVALLARQSASMFNGEAVHKINGNPSQYTNRKYYRERFAEDMAETISENPDLMNLAIFKYLTPTSEVVEVGEDPDTGLPIQKEVWRIDMQDVGGLDADTKEDIRESWSYLMEVDDRGYFKNDDYAELGRDLFMYCYYQLGFNFSPYSFMHLAPTAVKDAIVIPRGYSLAINSFTGTVNAGTKEKPSDDVLVWSSNVTGAWERAEDFNVSDRSVEGELMGNAYRLPDNLTVNDVRYLVHEAKSHPELKFKIDRVLTQEEFNFFRNQELGEDVPANIYFSEETLQNVSADSKEQVSYGQSRTYRQFLQEILDNKEQNISSDDFAQQFILNHLDNPRFVANVTKGNKKLWEVVSKQSGLTGTNFVDSFTIDLSNYLNKQDKDAISTIVSFTSDSRGNILMGTWAPCLKIGTSYYMPTGDGGRFNESTSTTMTFVKVEPWGCSSAITYDNNKKLSPSMKYQSSIDAMPEVIEDFTQLSVTTTEQDTPTGTAAENVLPESNEPLRGSSSNAAMLKEELENIIYNEYLAGLQRRDGTVSPEDLNGLRSTIHNSSLIDLKDTISALRQACRDNGVLMLDENGNPMMGC